MNNAAVATRSAIIDLLEKGDAAWKQIIFKLTGLRADGTLTEEQHEAMRVVSFELGEMYRADELSRTGASDMRDEVYALAM